MARAKSHTPEFDQESADMWIRHAKYLLHLAGSDLPDDVTVEQIENLSAIMLESSDTNDHQVGMMVISALGDSELGTPFQPYDLYRER